MDSYGHVSFIYNILSHDIQRRVWHIETYWHMFCLLVLILSCRSERRKTFLCPYVSLINQVLVNRSVIILYRLQQLSFARVVLDSGDFRKWIIASLNRPVYWKVGFQSLNRNIRKRCEIFSKLTMKTPDWHGWLVLSSVSFVDFEKVNVSL